MDCSKETAVSEMFPTILVLTLVGGIFGYVYILYLQLLTKTVFAMEVINEMIDQMDELKKEVIPRTAKQICDQGLASLNSAIVSDVRAHTVPFELIETVTFSETKERALAGQTLYIDRFLYFNPNGRLCGDVQWRICDGNFYLILGEWCATIVLGEHGKVCFHGLDPSQRSNTVQKFENLLAKCPSKCEIAVYFGENVGHPGHGFYNGIERKNCADCNTVLLRFILKKSYLH